jgi:hypothetical protein
MHHPIDYLHYAAVIFIGLAMLCSFIILAYSSQDIKKYSFNTWQFPMLLALFIDGILFLNK